MKRSTAAPPKDINAQLAGNPGKPQTQEGLIVNVNSITDQIGASGDNNQGNTA